MEHSTSRDSDSLQRLLVQFPSQLLLGAGLVVLTIAGVVAWHRYSTPIDTPLPGWHNVSPQEFEAAQRTLESRQLHSARLDRGTIRVPGDEVETYLNALLPRVSNDGATEHWADVWQQANDRLGRFSGSRERDAAREIARAQVVSRLLEDLPDIASADVVWDEDQQSGWRREQQTRATVYLRAAAGSVITPQMAHSVRMAVAGSKSHLAPEDVVVFDQGTMTAFSADQESATRTAVAQQQSNSLQRQLASALDYIDGLRVVVHVPELQGSHAASHLETDNRSSGQGTDTNDHVGSMPQQIAPPEISVTVSIPESYLRAVAGLDSPEVRQTVQSLEKRREVFRQVESQVARTVHEKVARLVPGGMTEAGWQRISIDTIPNAIVTVPASRRLEPVSFATLLNPGIMRLLALLTGLGAISLLIPRRQKTASRKEMEPSNFLPQEAIGSESAPPYVIRPHAEISTYPSEPPQSSPGGRFSPDEEQDHAANEVDEERLELERRWLAATEAMERRLTAPPVAPRHRDQYPESPSAPIAVRESNTAHVGNGDHWNVASEERAEPVRLAVTDAGPVPTLELPSPPRLASSPLERALTQLDSTQPPQIHTTRQLFETRKVGMDDSAVPDRPRNVAPALDRDTPPTPDERPLRQPVPAVPVTSPSSSTPRPKGSSANSTALSLTAESQSLSRPAAIGGQRCGGAAYEKSLRLDRSQASVSAASGSRTETPSRSAPRPSNPVATAERAPAVTRDRSATQPISNEVTSDLEALVDAPIEMVRDIAQQVPAEVWCRALFGASAKLKQRILPELPDASATQVRQTLAAVRPIRLRDIDTARQYVLDTCLAQYDFPLDNNQPDES